MRRLLVGGALLAVGLLTLGCSRDLGVEPAGMSDLDQLAAMELNARVAAMRFVESAGWEKDPQAWAEATAAVAKSSTDTDWQCFFGASREVIVDDVVHYWMNVIVTTTGDQIRLHRVVREIKPWEPIKTDDALVLCHGDLKDFEGMFMPGQFSPNLPDDFGFAVYLARNNVDVFGIDQAWNLVPAEQTDFSTFQDWGIEREMLNLSTACMGARNIRYHTGQGLDKILLLGYSSGAVTGYALLNAQTQWAETNQSVRGFIAADLGIKSDDPACIESFMGYYNYYKSLYDAGQYQDPLIFRDVALRARTDPDGESVYIPGLTNLQCALFFGGGEIFPPMTTHYHAPILADGLPVGFQYVTVDQWLDFLENTAAYEPILFELEYCALLAGLDSPYDDHLAQVTMPVLDIGAAGGIGPYTAATVGYLGSTDVTQLYVSTNADPVLDYGHIDIFTGDNAEHLVWKPILDWVRAHAATRGGSSRAVACMDTP